MGLCPPLRRLLLATADVLDEEKFNVELVVQCIRVSEMPQTHHHALLLLGTVASIFPVRINNVRLQQTVQTFSVPRGRARVLTSLRHWTWVLQSWRDPQPCLIADSVGWSIFLSFASSFLKWEQEQPLVGGSGTQRGAWHV